MAPRLVVVFGGSLSVLNPGDPGVDGALFSESSYPKKKKKHGEASDPAAAAALKEEEGELTISAGEREKVLEGSGEWKRGVRWGGVAARVGGGGGGGVKREAARGAKWREKLAPTSNGFPRRGGGGGRRGGPW